MNSRYAVSGLFAAACVAAAAAAHAESFAQRDPNLALVGLENTSGEVRNYWEYPVELGAVWKF